MVIPFHFLLFQMDNIKEAYVEKVFRLMYNVASTVVYNVKC